VQGIHRRSFIYRITLFILDFILVIWALITATTLRIQLNVGQEAVESAFHPPLILFPLAGLFWVFSLYLMKVYIPIYSKPFWQELQRLLFGHIVASFLFFGLLYLLYRDFSRLQAIYLVVLIYIFLLILRIGVRVYFSWRGFNQNHMYRVLIIGVGSHAQRVGEKISTITRQGIQLIGYISHAQSSPIIISANNIISTFDNVDDVIKGQQVDEVIIALDNQESVDLHQLVHQLGKTSVTIRLAVDFSEIAYFDMSIDTMVGVPLIGLREPVFTPTQKLFKRILDVALSSIGIIITSPLLLLITYAIKRNDRGPIIIRQNRIGQFGKPFEMYKFRSMYIDAPNPSYEWTENKHADDPRVTPIGKIIRRWSMDELPQLFNVLRGEMSLVGPRPELPEMVDMYQSWQTKRFEVPQGMTGWWQINGRSDKPMFENTQYDLYYITHYSIWMDIFILIRTVSAVISGRGAY
jgi:exopolysaccharide biosynthesis polyprenyl glycosylphosphotransferase